MTHGGGHSGNRLPGEEGGGGPSVLELSRTVSNLIKALSATALGISFIENPAGFVLAVMYLAIRDAVLGAAGWFAFHVRNFFVVVGTTVVDILAVLFGAPAVALARTVVGLINLADQLIDGLVAGTGPVAPVVAVLIWGVLAYGLLLLGSLIKTFILAVSPIP